MLATGNVPDKYWKIDLPLIFILPSSRYLLPESGVKYSEMKGY